MTKRVKGREEEGKINAEKCEIQLGTEEDREVKFVLREKKK